MTMPTINDRLTPAQVADACRLYILRKHKQEGKIAVSDETVLQSGTSDIHFMKHDGAPADSAFDYVMVSYQV
jgi:hypothetical protein